MILVLNYSIHCMTNKLPLGERALQKKRIHSQHTTGKKIRAVRREPVSPAKTGTSPQGEGNSRLVQALILPKFRTPDFAFTHGFHSYPGRCHPHLVRRLLEKMEARKGFRIFDPFMGGGTVLVEGMCRGFEVSGNDLNPIATLVARERCRLRTPLESRHVLRTVENLQQKVNARDGSAERKIILRRNVTWLKPHYAPHLFVELLTWIDAIDKLPPSPVRETLRAVFVGLVFRFSNECADPTGERKTPSIRKGVISRLMLTLTEELLKLQNEFNRKIPVKTNAAILSAKDINKLTDAPDGFQEKPVDLIITNPPMPDAYDYYRHYQLQLKWLDLSEKDLKHHEIGPRRMSPKQWKLFFREILLRLRKTLKPGGSCYLTLHDWREQDTPVDALGYFKKYAPSVGWTFQEFASLERPARFHEKFGRRVHLIHLKNPQPYKPPPEISEDLGNIE